MYGNGYGNGYPVQGGYQNPGLSAYNYMGAGGMGYGGMPYGSPYMQPPMLASPGMFGGMMGMGGYSGGWQPVMPQSSANDMSKGMAALLAASGKKGFDVKNFGTALEKLDELGAGERKLAGWANGIGGALSFTNALLQWDAQKSITEQYDGYLTTMENINNTMMTHQETLAKLQFKAAKDHDRTIVDLARIESGMNIQIAELTAKRDVQMHKASLNAAVVDGKYFQQYQYGTPYSLFG